MHRLRVVAVAVVLFAMALPLAAAKKPVVRPSVTLRIAFVAFYERKDDPSERRVREFLDRAISQTKLKNPGDYDFEIEYVRGNYYQVLRWLRSGEIDGALVSPFTYALLVRDVERDGGSSPIGLAEVTLPGVNGGEGGNRPIYRIIRNGSPLADPGKELEGCIDRTSKGTGEPCTFQFTAHLSTTGFLYPLLKAAGRVSSQEGWTALLRASHFTAWHGVSLPPKGTALQFSYESRLIPSGGKPEDYTGWRPLFPERNQERFLGDVLVLSRNSTAVKEYGEDLAMLFAQTQAYGWLTPDRKEPKKPERIYDRALEVDQVAAERLQEDVRRLFANPHLEKTLSRWFDDEEYDFTVGELALLLKNDQIVNGQIDDGTDHASIVLPGGGVRGAYQARILDALYDDYLLNANYQHTERLTEKQREARLLVRSIIGTSGGALVGYLAARRGPFDNRGTDLTARWINRDTNEVLVTPMRVFPAFGTLRWLSVMVSVLIFAVIAVILSTPRPATAITGPPPYIFLAFLFCVLGAPLLMSRLSVLDHRFVPKSEGIPYAAIVLIVHFLHTTLRASGTKPAHRWRDAFLGFAGVVISLAVAADVLTDVKPNAVDSWLSMLSIVLFIFSIVRLAQWHGMVVDPERAKEYAKALVVLAIFFLLTFTMFAVAAAQGMVTPLEMTGEYWKVGAAASVIAAVAISLLAIRISLVREGLALWFGRVSDRYNPMGILLLFGFAGIGAWLLFVAPAVYSGENGARTFADQAKLVGRPQTAFLAALTTLGDDRDQPAGGYFAYEGILDRQTGMPSPSLLRLSPQQLVEAVCASGSPFPIYPGRPVKHGERETTFIDGGFTHLVPIKGAIELKAKQILIISNAARADKKLLPTKRASMLGLLVTNGGKTIGFLFDRSQATDLGLQKSALVATIAPAWSTEDPFLMDFRADTIRTLVDEAERDLKERRPGRIVSWGQPRVVF